MSMLLQYNLRMDYLAQVIHPTKFIREDLIASNGGSLDLFDPSPYASFRFSKKIADIQKAVWYDRFPDISPQAFMEDTKLSQLMQEMTAHPNYMKGMGGQQALANETATGIVSLIDEGTARTSFRALMMEYTGLHDELTLFLKYGKMYRWEDEAIRVNSTSGWPWVMIPFDAIDDGYGIELLGTRQMLNKNETMKRLLSLLPFFVNNPNVPNQNSLFRQTARKFDVFDNPDALFSAPPPAAVAPGMGVTPMPGQPPGAGGMATLQNEGNSRGNRTGIPAGRAGTGVPASFSV